ncbi:hydroxypyruvate isomerase [Plantibacter flavus]|uniref:Hydroxypyruvate isomerase n=1 Tax=Plantibacter flavus TaxID=150123 RepID=A0A3N2C2H5_9MICO|nr:TIM barrel protein [Plantibacter flavus]ROR81716.1 hydroxypyruvate isomerase [Plantibacter flavus]SMG15970.1 hydroxypyruvate isomerase [Plantibacter flavus]
MQFSANLSIMFTEVPFLERFTAAKSAGFDDVECWWPFATPVPEEAEFQAFLAAIERAEVSLRAINLYAGDMPSGDRGVLSHPGAEHVLADNTAIVARIAEATGCRTVNALYGVRPDGVSDDALRETAVGNLQRIVAVLAPLGVTVVLEPLTNGENGSYPLSTVDDAFDVLDRVDHPAVRLLFDAYHLHNNGTDVVHDVVTYIDRIGHVQLADSPGRGEPGSGTIDFAAFFEALTRSGYDGFIGCEYRPSTTTAESLGWLAELSRNGQVASNRSGA